MIGFRKIMSPMEIYFSTLDRTNREIIRIPYILPNIELGSSLDTEEFETISGQKLLLTGKEGLRTFSISSFFPSKFYSWLLIPNHLLSPSYIDFFKRNRTKTLRVVVLNLSLNLNMLCVIKEFKHSKKQNGDIDYTLEIQEYTDISGGKSA